MFFLLMRLACKKLREVSSKRMWLLKIQVHQRRPFFLGLEHRPSLIYLRW